MTREYELKYDYKNEVKDLEAFFELAKKTFGIDFKPWYEKGYWNDQYKTYSLFDQDKAIANVSTNELDLIIKGKEVKALQLGTIMTDKEYRKQGLAAKLMNYVLEKNKDRYDLIYLFANNSVLEFYPKFGFEKIEQCGFSSAIKSTTKKIDKIRKLDINDNEDKQLIIRLTQNRTPISNKVGVTKDQHLLMFYIVNVFFNHVYYLEELDTIVIYTVNDGVLTLFDLITHNEIKLDDIINLIADENINKIIYTFTPDMSQLMMNIEAVDDDNTLFVLPSNIEFPKEFIFPEISHA